MTSTSNVNAQGTLSWKAATGDSYGGVVTVPAFWNGSATGNNGKPVTTAAGLFRHTCTRVRSLFVSITLKAFSTLHKFLMDLYNDSVYLRRFLYTRIMILLLYSKMLMQCGAFLTDLQIMRAFLLRGPGGVVEYIHSENGYFNYLPVACFETLTS
jgi:hypothetical protein